MNLEDLIYKINDYDISDKNSIIRAFEVAKTIHKNQYRKSKEPYITHPVSVASILASIHADSDTIIAGLLHDTVEDSDSFTIEDIEKLFNETIASLVDSVTKIKREDEISEMALTNRKLLESMLKDVRGVIVKLADRLHNMRTMEYQTHEKQVKKSQETMDLYVPIATMLGLYDMKLELEDLSFKYLFPIEYSEMEQLQDWIKKYYRDILDDMICSLSNNLKSDDINYNFLVKYKSLFGLYRRLRHHGSLDKIHDLVSLQVILNRIDECYKTKNIIENNYDVINEKTKDYISSPKPNKYKALHLSIHANEEIMMQLQLETPGMHNINQNGITAYYKMMKTKDKIDTYAIMQDEVKKMQFYSILQELLDSNLDSLTFNKKVQKDLLSKKIVVFTPDNKQIELPDGATPIDFAYQISDELGDNISGVTVNGVKVPLNYRLENRNIVKIYTNDNLYGPNLPLSNYCFTEYAKSKIKTNKTRHF